MQRNVVDSFTICVRFFMDLDRGIIISPHEVHTIYVSKIIKIMERTKKDNILGPCDSTV
jgi:hypothetical protein